MVGLNDSHYVSNHDDRKSIVGYVFNLGSELITWPCKKQQDLALSSTEVEYQAIYNSSQEALWLRQIFSEFGFEQQ